MSPETRTIEVGLVGCGELARTAHLGILAALPGVRLAALAEPDPARRQAAAAAAPGARALADWRELLALEGLDAVVLCLPPALHAEAAIAALSAGKDVYVEKPMATDLGAAKSVLAAWRESGRVGMIGFNYRFNALYRDAKRILDAGELGRPVAARSVFAIAEQPMAEWKTARRTGGGVLLDLASHHVDLVRHLLGEIIEVSGAIHAAATEGDTATLELRLAEGALVQGLYSHRAADEDRLEVYGERGCLKVDRGAGLAVEVSAGTAAARRRDRLRHAWRSARGLRYGLERHRAPGHEPSWGSALQAFVAAVRGEDFQGPDLEDGFRSLEVVLAAEESERTGRSVALPPRGATRAEARIGRTLRERSPTT